jgi:hypothetical protein
MSAKAHAAKKRRKEELRARQIAAMKPTVADAYVAERIARVRAHIVATDDALERAREPLDRERLSRALAALSELERNLSGRPAAGVLKPRPAKEPAVTGY